MANTNQGPQRQISIARTDYRYFVFFTAILALVSIGGTLWYQVPLTFETSSPLVALPFFFGPLTCVAGFIAFRGFLRQRKIGTPVLEYSPARRGGMLTGSVALDKQVKATGDFSLRLTCFDYGPRDYNGERSRKSPKATWKGDMTIARADVESSGRINFSIKLPPADTVRATQEREVYWLLDIRAPMRGVNFFARFSPVINR